MSKKEFQITKELNGLRLDQALAHFLESRTQALRWIQERKVHIENIPIVKPSYKVKEGTHIVLSEWDMKIEKESLEPYNFPINIVYEDSSLLVVEKPAGLVSHPSCGHPHDSLINALIHKLNLKVGYSPKRPGLLHRLDKDVSGLLVLSKTQKAQNVLSKQFLTKKIKRKYWALCYGPVRFDEGKIETFIKRHPVDRKKFIVSDSEGKKAITLFKVLKKKQDELALVEFQLETGRTHQVRIHSNEITGGIVGDEVYTSSKRINKISHSILVEKINSLKRIALHAVELVFTHPETKKEIIFQSPFPKELQTLLDLNQ